MCEEEKKALRRVVRHYYRRHGRHDLPWRLTSDPYAILVSEVMLQQTQVGRVIPKYLSFMNQFPRVEVLAQAPLREVLVVWQGLGYNRRAKMLHDAAGEVCATYEGVIPKEVDALRALPGVGAYTASAVRVFAHALPEVLIETNIRTVLFHHVYRDEAHVADTVLRECVAALLPRQKVREWYWGLMDYGSFLKQNGVRNNAQSLHYKKQSTFAGSTREVRGAIVRTLAQGHAYTLRALVRAMGTHESAVVRTQLERLVKEGVVRVRRGSYTL